MKKTILILGILFILIGESVVSSTEHLATEYKKLNINHIMKSPTVLLDEDFSGDFPPEGWSMDGWEQKNSSCCGSEPPCAALYKYNQSPPSYISSATSKAIDASECEKFVISFYFGIDVYYDNYVQVYLKYRRNETGPWIDITPWCNPIESDMCDYFEIEVMCGSECCGDALQINWSYVGYYYYFNYLWLDDVKILSGYDDTPPVTTCSLDPPEPDGNYGWYISNVTVMLNATDENGVDATYYRINGGEWETYNIPFIIVQEGKDIIIEFYSVDNLGNVEDVKNDTLDIDKTPPEMIVNISKIKDEWHKWWVIVNVTFTDNLSGVVYDSMDRIEFYLNDVLQDTVTGPGPDYTWKFLYSGGLKITIGVGAHICDKAGNCDDLFNETQIYFSRNRNQLFMNQIFLRFLDHFPLLQRILNIWWYNIV